MRVFFDERCLSAPDLATLLRTWRQAADLATSHMPGLSLYFDRDAARKGGFLQRFNSLTKDQRVFFADIVFGSDKVKDWRPLAIAPDSLCQLETENTAVEDCAICEAYEHRKNHPTTALFGHNQSSYAARSLVRVTKIFPVEPQLELACGTSIADFRKIGRDWQCLVVEYELTLKRPPLESETVLEQAPERFVRVGKVERNGRRPVYRELVTNHLYYVDGLHFGAAAHLEVFNADEAHIGIADLQGNVDASKRVQGRRLLW